MSSSSKEAPVLSYDVFGEELLLISNQVRTRDEWFRDVIHDAQGSWRQVIAAAVTAGVPVPALTLTLTAPPR